MTTIKKVLTVAVVALNATVLAGLLGVPNAGVVNDVAGHAGIELPPLIRQS